MSAIQLSFSLRTTSNVKQVHLIGSWDSYSNQLPLSRDSQSSKWKGTFRFQPSVLQPGTRYWFYYMLDGYHVSHDPSKDFTVEPTTGRNLNILDVPMTSSSTSSSGTHGARSSKRGSRRYSREIPRGRPADEIRSPKPVRPGHLARTLEAAAKNQAALDALTARLANSRLTEYDEDSSDIDTSSSEEEGTDSDSDVPSLSSGGSSISSSSSPSSLSSASSGCSCERYGITRRGQRVKLDCGGKRCGGHDDYEDGREESCSSEEENHRHRVRTARRHGVVIR